MPSPNEKFKKHKFVRTPGGKTKRNLVKKKTSKQKCAVCSKVINGVPHGLRDFEVKRLSKTQRRPENLLSSILCPKCREIAYHDAVMFKYKLKTEKDLDFRYKKYIEMIQNKIE
jgi:large subunit ribosomal protein L34e